MVEQLMKTLFEEYLKMKSDNSVVLEHEKIALERATVLLQPPTVVLEPGTDVINPPTVSESSLQTYQRPPNIDTVKWNQIEKLLQHPIKSHTKCSFNRAAIPAALLSFLKKKEMMKCSRSF